MTEVRPVSPARLVDELASRIAALPRDRWLRVAVDGPPSAEPAALADALVDPLRVRGRAAIRVRAEDFLRPASLRLELGRHNPDAYYERWHDLAETPEDCAAALLPSRRLTSMPTRTRPAPRFSRIVQGPASQRATTRPLMAQR